MRIAIHHREGSFSSYWLAWCQRHGVQFDIVDAYRSDLVDHLRSMACDGFMWHWSLGNYADQLFARQLTLAIEGAGIKVFPDVRTAWHYDDKIGQKYLFESIGVPFVKTSVFYDRSSALAWIEECEYPIVHKLRSGAGSMNVRKVRNQAEARALVRRAFAEGFAPFDLHALSREALWRLRREKSVRNLLRVPYSMLRAVLGATPGKASLRPRERGYVYFQEFLGGNEFDDRFVVIGERCFCVRRRVRAGDFRASGSGLTTYDPNQFPPASVTLAFEVADRIHSQSLALDVIYEESGDPRCVEISYAFPPGPFLEDAGGYFDRDGVWRETAQAPPMFMIEDFVASLR